MHDTSEPSVMELLFDQLEELLVTIVEEVRERPGVALAIVAAVVGAVVGSILAARGRKSSPPMKQVAKRARSLTDTGQLMGLATKLLQNPIVRGYLMNALQKQLRSRFPL